MFQSFTGTSRKPRQVNLSGRKPNPFAAAGGSGGPQQAVLSAHQDRQQRQQQRAELNAAKNIQKTWRGYNCRKRARDAWRRQWDATEEQARNARFYRSAEESLAALRRLLLFFSVHEETDTERLIRYGRRQVETVAVQGNCSGSAWNIEYLRLERACLAALRERVRTRQVSRRRFSRFSYLLPLRSRCRPSADNVTWFSDFSYFRAVWMIYSKF